MPQSAPVWMASANIAPDRVKNAATPFTTAMTRLTARDWRMWEVEESALTPRSTTNRGACPLGRGTLPHHMPFTPADFRRALGSFASGITVIATEVDQVIHGMTASAFISVSMDPPLVLVSVARSAHLHPLVLASRAYTVSILGEQQAHLSNHFAGRPDAGVSYTWRRLASGAPVLGDAIAVVDCTLDAAHDAGDHTLFIGRVRDLDTSATSALVYFRGRYQALTTLAPT